MTTRDPEKSRSWPLYAYSGISQKMAGDRRLVLKDIQYEIVYSESNGSVTDDVTLSWKIKLVTSIRLGPNVSKTAGDAV